ncbi:M15 family metallopeptidase domain-containing protein [Microbacterium saperdae]
MISRSRTVDIGGSRGRLTPAAAASLRRVDAELGRLTDVNSAWRDPKTQQEFRDAYLAYLDGGPWAPIALAPEDSVHCDGEAIDTDDGYNPHTVAILNRHGWFHTVYRWINGKRVLVEPWHLERDASRDQHRRDPAPAGGANTTPAEPDDPEEDDMKPTVHARQESGNDTEWTLGHPDIGKDLPVFTGTATTSNSRLTPDKSVKVFRGFMVTVDRAIFTAWARAYAKGTSEITSRTDRAGYVDIQKQLSLTAAEITPK